MTRMYHYWCWKKGTTYKDGARFLAETKTQAIQRFCSAWNLTEEEVNCELQSELIK